MRIIDILRVRFGFAHQRELRQMHENFTQLYSFFVLLLYSIITKHCIQLCSNTLLLLHCFNPIWVTLQCQRAVLGFSLPGQHASTLTHTLGSRFVT